MEEEEYLLLVDGKVYGKKEYFRLLNSGHKPAGPVQPSSDRDWLIRNTERLIHNFYRGRI